MASLPDNKRNKLVQADGILKIAVVHEWLVSYAGSERVLEQILACFPEADLFAVVDFLSDEQRRHIGGKHPKTTFIQNLPWARKLYRHYLPLMPLAIEQLDLAGYDLVISSSHAVAKGVLTGPDQFHICYCHSPMRYAWDMQHQYLRDSGLDHGLRGWLAKRILHRIRLWDVRTEKGVDAFLANSRYIARRIQKAYRRESTVVYPPVDVESFAIHQKKDRFYLAASRMVTYKKMDLIVEAFSAMPDKKLIVIGDGPDWAKVSAKAGPNVCLLGYQKFEVLRDHMQRARAFVFAAEEDFGIIPVEAQACGTPVIAYRMGGAAETIRGIGSARPSGVFFDKQRVSAIIEAVQYFEENEFSPEACRENALRFSVDRFQQDFKQFILRSYDQWHTQSNR